ncbi:hypothetical protein PMKS-001758 [Pichia membranifaciens]|uniref:Gfd2/YDR514C-like C-terminal domain-containing protein n=1 Tax=Pichia membranifaciens TaxID=4926 RepID=A0A1Q2YFJ2_9ASCO|nr:hypothetical protein PMKS-001758 [Pichia membranifaciens]
MERKVPHKDSDQPTNGYSSEGSISSSVSNNTLSDRYDLKSIEAPSSDAFDSVESRLRYELQKCISNLPAKYKPLKKTFSEQKTETDSASLKGSLLPSKSETSELPKKKKELQNIYLSVEEAIELVNKREFTLISIDNEFFERSTSKVIEIGISIYSPTYQKYALFPHFLNFHFIIKEFINLRNGLFVPDSKMNNITGQSLIISKRDVPRAMSLIFEILGPKVCIVGHNVSGDIKSFKYLNYELPSSIKIIDTVNLWYSFVGSSSGKSSLSFILDKLNIPNAFLHNGVNDAYFTLVVSLMLTSPELRNNLAFKKLPNNEEKEDEAAKPETEEDVSEVNEDKETPPDFSSFLPEMAEIKMKRWLRKKSKAEAKAKKKLSGGGKESAVPVHIRCSIDEEAILQKQRLGLHNNKSGKLKNPPSNKFFKPINYEEEKLSQKLGELSV